MNSLDNTRTWETDDVVKLAMQIREGLNYCKDNRELVGDRLADLKDKLILKSLPGKVQVSLRTTILVRPIGTHSKSYPEVTTLSEVITNVIKDNHLNEWRFTSISLDSINIKKLLKWAQSENKVATQQGDSIIIRNGETKTSDKEEHRD